MAMVPRPTVYKGIRMRSRLEARAAAHLDDVGLHWVYEPRAYAGDGGQYLPDFEILDLSIPMFIEVKPTKAAARSCMDRMRIIRESLPTAGLVILVGDGTAYTFEERADEDLYRWVHGWAKRCQP